jgi:hypothetical protein
MGSDVRLAGPGELHPPKDVVQIAEDIAGRTSARITVTEDPAQAVAGADFIHTDVWVSKAGTVRRLASVVFALLALEELGSPTADRAVAVIAITVLLSVVAHGATAEPLAARYTKLLAHRAVGDRGVLMPDMPDRRLIRRSSPPQG